MGMAGWQKKYPLCFPPDLTPYYLPLPSPPLCQQQQAEAQAQVRTKKQKQLRFPYYSSVGDLSSLSAEAVAARAEVEMAMVVQHGASRNGDDYYCSGLQVKVKVTVTDDD